MADLVTLALAGGGAYYGGTQVMKIAKTGRLWGSDVAGSQGAVAGMPSPTKFEYSLPPTQGSRSASSLRAEYLKKKQRRSLATQYELSQTQPTTKSMTLGA